MPKHVEMVRTKCQPKSWDRQNANHRNKSGQNANQRLALCPVGILSGWHFVRTPTDKTRQWSDLVLIKIIITCLATLGIKLLMLFFLSVDVDGASSLASILANFWFKISVVTYVMFLLNKVFYLQKDLSMAGSRRRSRSAWRWSFHLSQTNCDNFFWSSLVVPQ